MPTTSHHPLPAFHTPKAPGLVANAPWSYVMPPKEEPAHKVCVLAQAWYPWLSWSPPGLLGTPGFPSLLLASLACLTSLPFMASWHP